MHGYRLSARRPRRFQKVNDASSACQIRRSNAKQVLQAEIDRDAYEFILNTADSEGLTLREAIRQAAIEWAAREDDLSFDPFFDFSIVSTKGTRKCP